MAPNHTVHQLLTGKRKRNNNNNNTNVEKSLSGNDRGSSSSNNKRPSSSSASALYPPGSSSSSFSYKNGHDAKYKRQYTTHQTKEYCDHVLTSDKNNRDESASYQSIPATNQVLEKLSSTTSSGTTKITPPSLSRNDQHQRPTTIITMTTNRQHQCDDDLKILRIHEAAPLSPKIANTTNTNINMLGPRSTIEGSSAETASSNKMNISEGVCDLKNAVEYTTYLPKATLTGAKKAVVDESNHNKRGRHHQSDGSSPQKQFERISSSNNDDHEDSNGNCNSINASQLNTSHGPSPNHFIHQQQRAQQQQQQQQQRQIRGINRSSRIYYLRYKKKRRRQLRKHAERVSSNNGNGSIIDSTEQSSSNLENQYEYDRVQQLEALVIARKRRKNNSKNSMLAAAEQHLTRKQTETSASSSSDSLLRSLLEKIRGRTIASSSSSTSLISVAFDDPTVLPFILFGVCAISRIADWCDQKRHDELLLSSPHVHQIISLMIQQQSQIELNLGRELEREKIKRIALQQQEMQQKILIKSLVERNRRKEFEELIDDGHEISLRMLSQRHHQQFDKNNETIQQQIGKEDQQQQQQQQQGKTSQSVLRHEVLSQNQHQSEQLTNRNLLVAVGAIESEVTSTKTIDIHSSSSSSNSIHKNNNKNDGECDTMGHTTVQNDVINNEHDNISDDILIPGSSNTTKEDTQATSTQEFFVLKRPECYQSKKQIIAHTDAIIADARHSMTDDGLLLLKCQQHQQEPNQLQYEKQQANQHRSPKLDHFVLHDNLDGHPTKDNHNLLLQAASENPAQSVHFGTLATTVKENELLSEYDRHRLYSDENDQTNSYYDFPNSLPTTVIFTNHERSSSKSIPGIDYSSEKDDSDIDDDDTNNIANVDDRFDTVTQSKSPNPKHLQRVSTIGWEKSNNHCTQTNIGPDNCKISSSSRENIIDPNDDTIVTPSASKFLPIEATSIKADTGTSTSAFHLVRPNTRIEDAHQTGKKFPCAERSQSDKSELLLSQSQNILPRIVHEEARRVTLSPPRPANNKQHNKTNNEVKKDKKKSSSWIKKNANRFTSYKQTSMTAQVREKKRNSPIFPTRIAKAARTNLSRSHGKENVIQKDSSFRDERNSNGHESTKKGTADPSRKDTKIIIDRNPDVGASNIIEQKRSSDDHDNIDIFRDKHDHKVASNEKFKRDDAQSNYMSAVPIGKKSTEKYVAKKQVEEVITKKDFMDSSDDGSDARDEGSLGYKYEEVVRGKDARAALNGYTCPDCGEFFDAMMEGEGANVYKRSEFLCCSRHRGRHTPPQTPQDFWELSFADSQVRKLND